MGVSLHQHPIFPLALPLAKTEGKDVLARTIGSMLEVVAAKARWVLARSMQHVAAVEQAHRWSHSHKHLIEVDEDCHHCDGVRRQVLKLKPVMLQQHEEEEWWHEPRQGI
jgi:hypothetical protein